uniref:Major facilitator superfamily domain containing 4Aa n=1 Tax=Salmo trutta TaxID=8032 RepID=A0A673ZN92_SALTR
MLVDDLVWALFKRHWQHTLTYWSVFFSFGLCIAFLGPTILDLRCQTQSTLQEITWVFFAQQLSLLLGMSDVWLRCALSALFISSLVISVVFAIIPLCHHVLMLAVAMAISGMAMGVIDTIANQQLVKLYQKDSAVFLQVLQFFIGLGVLVSPLVADPFLSEGSCVLGGGNMTANSSTDLHHLRSSLTGKGTTPLHNVSHHYHLHTQGIIITTNISYLSVPVAVYLLMYRERLFPCSNQSPRLLDKEKNQQDHNIQGKTPLTQPRGKSNITPLTQPRGHGGLLGCCNYDDMKDCPASYFLYILGGAVLFITDGIIDSFTPTQSPPLSLPHKMAGYLTSVFWASVTAGRLASIYLSYRYTQQRLINVMGVIVVQCLLLILYSSHVSIFMGTCVLGLFISSVFPCMVALTEDMVNYKGTHTVRMFVFEII